MITVTELLPDKNVMTDDGDVRSANDFEAVDESSRVLAATLLSLHFLEQSSALEVIAKGGDTKIRRSFGGARECKRKSVQMHVAARQIFLESQGYTVELADHDPDHETIDSYHEGVKVWHRFVESIQDPKDRDAMIEWLESRMTTESPKA